MADTLQEFETPDTAAKAAKALESYQEKTDDLVGEKLTLNMGPSHPATHGVLRLILELDGEVITKADPDVGYLHRGDEKIEEKVHKDHINLLSCRNWYIYILNFCCKCKQSKPTNYKMCQSENAAKVKHA